LFSLRELERIVRPPLSEVFRNQALVPSRAFNSSAPGQNHPIWQDFAKYHPQITALADKY
jgi:hypothetical protein